jgi:hypothetical protein
MAQWKKALIIVCLTLLSLGLANSTRAQDAKAQQAQEIKAQQAAETILRRLSKQEFKGVWDQATSEWAKKNWSEDAFLSSMAIGRPQLGVLQGLQVIGREYSNKDSMTGYEGDIYAITFRSKYSLGEFYERIVLNKDQDGEYRLSGIYGSPVPAK